MNEYQRDSGWPRHSSAPPAAAAPRRPDIAVEPLDVCGAAVSVIRARHPTLPLGAITVLPQPHDQVADSGIKALVARAGSSDPLGLMVVSSPVDPGATERAVSVARNVRARLGPDIGSVVLEPLASGSVAERSFVLWPFHRQLSTSRAAKLVHGVRLYPRVLRWLFDVARHTAQVVPEPARERMYGATLRAIASEREFPAKMRAAAEIALGALGAKTWVPRSVLEHNDLWSGNILLPHAGSDPEQHPRGMIVIDWEGARFEGYPALDLVRFAMSVNLPRPWLRLELAKLRGLLQCELSELLSYTLAALGAMGQDLGYFPVERYRALAVEAFDTLSRLC